MQDTFINEFSLSYDFHNDVFFSLACFIVTTYCICILHNAYKIPFPM